MDTFQKIASTNPLVNFGANIKGIIDDANNTSEFEDLSSPSTIASGPEGIKEVTKIILLEPANTDAPLLSASPAAQIIQIIILALALFMAAKCKKNGDVSIVQLVLAALCSPCYILFRIIRPC